MNGYIVRELKPSDVRAVADLLQAYMRETYDMAWPGGVSGLIRDGFGARFKMLIATLADHSVGFLAWETAYDLHHCMIGGHVLDLYVEPGHRRKGLAVKLIAKATAVIHALGGAFVKGGAVESGSGSRLYGRFAPAFGNEFILGGKAFRHLGTLPELPIRQLVRALPRKEWNFEP